MPPQDAHHCGKIQSLQAITSLSISAQFSLNAFFVTDDDIIICDPESEYGALVERLNGQVINISPTSTDYVNPMDLNLNYSDEENHVSHCRNGCQ